MTARARVDAELVRRGLARSRRHAAELVAAGRVSVDGRTVAKPSAAVADDAGVAVTPGDPGEAAYASRAGLKLAGALDALAAGRPAGTGSGVAGVTRAGDVFLVAPPGPTTAASTPAAPVLEGAWCADLGASTGGFTDVLLRRGATHVVAIDVGHGQLLERLREDPRVTVVEGRNVRDLGPADLERAPDVVTGDLSFISLTLVLPAIAAVLAPRGTALLLVKPQFEVGREQLGRGGVVRDPALHATAITTVVRAAEHAGLRLRAIVPSPLPGPSGNREFFVWLVADDEVPAVGPRQLSDAVTAAVAPGTLDRNGRVPADTRHHHDLEQA
ncbi:TlyA family RNA methyltransferase [Myceligenerans salitolerans]|uniref:TlyA family RNA methyltransferase n=1 Tax=Myceligenerans salitolerans TaxID=1230528 RepID=A0ABS3I439_9MICO|nr:TlyA family RNA methyltransferase [Myceligenerans salitolerans]MBO0607762.1 TlyA family RNA methyltransferase [Myceligenerans salitolerans]